MFGAKKRGIEWQFTYDEWVDWWGDDIHKRGPYRGQLVMARYNDTGPYHPDNVFKTTCSQNVRDAQHHKPLMYNGLYYRTLTDLSKDIGRSVPYIRKRLMKDIEYV